MFAAIPTVYAGVQFRSRLEARWAAYFDLLGLYWQYESIELAGYIPDFLVAGPSYLAEQEVLVEVKPAACAVDLADACRKVVGSGWSGISAIAGRDPSVSVLGIRLKTDRHNGRFLHLSGDLVWITGKVFAEEACEDWRDRWKEAGNLTQYKSPRTR